MGARGAVLMLLAANLAWGGSYAVAKVALEALTPLQLAAWRMVPAGLVAAALLLRGGFWRTVPLRDWPWLVLLSLFAFGVDRLLEYAGVHLSTASNVALLQAAEPLFTIALGVIILGERLQAYRLAAFVFGAAGAWLLVARGFGWPHLGIAALGDLLFMASLALEAAYSVLGKGLLARIGAARVTLATIALSLPVWGAVAGGDIALHGLPAVTPGVLVAVAFLGVGCTLLAYWAWFRALAHLDAGVVALSLFVQPLFGLLLGVVWLGDPLRPSMVVGGALVLFSLYLALRPELRRARTPA